MKLQSTISNVLNIVILSTLMKIEASEQRLGYDWGLTREVYIIGRSSTSC